MSARAAGDVRREQRGAAARQRQRRPRHGEGGGGGGGSGAGPAATAAAMAAVGERRSLPSPEAMLGQPWSHWVDAAKLHGNDGEWPPSTAATPHPLPPLLPGAALPAGAPGRAAGSRARRGARLRSHPRRWRPGSLCGARPPGRLGSGAERAAPAPVPVIRDTVRGGRSRSPEPGTSCPGFRLGVGRAAAAAGEASPPLTAGPRSPRSLCSCVRCRVPTGERLQVTSGGQSYPLALPCIEILWLFLVVLGTALEESFKEYGRNREAMRLCREGECDSFLKKSARRSFAPRNCLAEGQAWEGERIRVSHWFGFGNGGLSVTDVISIIIKLLHILKTTS